MKNRNHLILSVLLLAIFMGVVFRLWKFTSLPFPPNGDEVAFAYYGWSILNFQTDEYGNFLPVYFPSIGDYKYPTFAYLNTIPAAIFGLNEITVRFWSLLFGILMIPVMFLISFLIFNSMVVALATAWLIALEPWSITLSRYGYEAHIAVFLTSLAVLLILISISNKETLKKSFLLSRFHYLSRKTKPLLFISFVLLILSSFCYGAQRLFIPLFLFLLLIISFINKKDFGYIRKYLLLLFLSLTIIISLSLIPWQSRGRASGVIWGGFSEEQQENISLKILEDGIAPIRLPIFVTRAFHNKLLETGIDFYKRYSSHFTPQFLFLEGDRSLETIPNTGILMLIESAFLLIGLMTFMLSIRNNKKVLVPLIWLITGPVASAITVEPPHILRGAIGFPALTLLSGYGLSRLLSLFRGRYYLIFTFIIVALVVFNSFWVLHNILIHRSVHRPWQSDQATSTMVKEILKIKDSYSAVILPDDQYIFFLFYGKIKPMEFLANSKILPESKDIQWERVERLTNIYFKMPYDCPKGGKLNVLYVCKGGEVPQNSNLVKVFYFQDKIPAYSLVEFYPISKIPNQMPSLPENLHYMVEVEKNPQFPDGIIPDYYTSFW